MLRVIEGKSSFRKFVYWFSTNSTSLAPPKYGNESEISTSNVNEFTTSLKSRLRAFVRAFENVRMEQAISKRVLETVNVPWLSHWHRFSILCIAREQFNRPTQDWVGINCVQHWHHFSWIDLTASFFVWNSIHYLVIFHCICFRLDTQNGHKVQNIWNFTL